MPKTIQIQNETGNINDYVPFSERLGIFIDKFSIEDGYSVIIETSGNLDASPALLSLYKEAIAAGKNPVDVGLPVIKELAIFTAKLLKDGQAIQSASSCKLILNYKDWEIGETASRQRLAASLGFGSEEFLSDELADMQAQTLTVISNTDKEKVSNVNLDHSNKHEETVTAPVSQIAPKATKQQADSSTSNEQSGHINVQLIRRIHARATPKNIDVPEFKNETEAKAFYKKVCKR